MRNRSLHHHSVMSASHCPGIFCKNLNEWQTNGMWSVYIALLMTQWFTRSTTTNHFCSPTVFTEGRGPQTGTICQAHAVYETQTTLPADLSGLGLTASDQSAAVLLLLCWTWGVSEQTMLVCIHVCVWVEGNERVREEYGWTWPTCPLSPSDVSSCGLFPNPVQRRGCDVSNSMRRICQSLFCFWNVDWRVTDLCWIILKLSAIQF